MGLPDAFGQSALGQALSKTPGLHYVFEAATGHQSHVTKGRVERETENAIRHGLRNGVNLDGSRMTQAQKDAVVADVRRQQDDFVRASGAHPDDATFFGSVGFQGLLPTFEAVRKVVGVVTLVAASALTLYFGFKFYQATRRR